MQRPPLCLSAEAALQSAAYRARHVLPTIASAMRLDDRESAALSNWRCPSDEGAAKAANSMQMLYDQSKVPQQCVSKLLCVLGIADAIKELDDYNLSWSHYTAKVQEKATYYSEARKLSVGLRCPEGDSMATKEGAMMPYKPSTLPKSVDGQSEASSRQSSPEPTKDKEDDTNALEEQLMLAESVNMVFSKAARTGYVHLHNSAKDTQYGRKGQCGVCIAHVNSHCCTAWEASRERGQLDWCPRCKSKWPEKLAGLIDP
jgi:hypothetical protein